MIVQYSFLFPTVKNYKNPPRETRVIFENNVASFFPDTVYFLFSVYISIEHFGGYEI